MLHVFLLVAALALTTPARAAAEEAKAEPDSQAPAEKAAAPAAAPGTNLGRSALDNSGPPAALSGRPLVEETPLMAEARKRPPKDLWNEMGLIQDEMRLFVTEGRHDSLPDLADRWVTDMMAAFTQVYEVVILPRQVGLKRAAMSCAHLGQETRRLVDLGQPAGIERAVKLVEGCNRLFARFLPPDVTGLPDEFANWKPRAATDPAAEGSKPQ